MTTNDEKSEGLSRREFLKISSLAASVPLVARPKMILVDGQEVAVHGPGPVPVALTANGRRLTCDVEPRVTLLDALREHFDITGPKRVCDRAECGACTVLIDGRAVYSCTTLAIEAQGKEIVTAEGLGGGEQPHPVQSAFVNNDAQQCGFCTPGFTVPRKRSSTRVRTRAMPRSRTTSLGICAAAALTAGFMEWSPRCAGASPKETRGQQ